MIATIKLIFLLFASPISQKDKISTVYELMRCEEIEITSAIILFETGRMKCKKCALSGKNLLGFRTKNGYIVFNTYAESIRFYRRWQSRYWLKYKKRNPTKDYYSFLKYIRYCDKMDRYIKTLKYIQKHG